MVQMSAHDQAIVKAIPGNSKCMDCGELKIPRSFLRALQSQPSSLIRYRL